MSLALFRTTGQRIQIGDYDYTLCPLTLGDLADFEAFCRDAGPDGFDGLAHDRGDRLRLAALLASVDGWCWHDYGDRDPLALIWLVSRCLRISWREATPLVVLAEELADAALDPDAPKPEPGRLGSLEQITRLLLMARGIDPRDSLAGKLDPPREQSGPAPVRRPDPHRDLVAVVARLCKTFHWTPGEALALTLDQAVAMLNGGKQRRLNFGTPQSYRERFKAWYGYELPDGPEPAPTTVTEEAI